MNYPSINESLCFLIILSIYVMCVYDLNHQILSVKNAIHPGAPFELPLVCFKINAAVF